MNEEKLYTIKQLSKMLNIPETTLRGLVYRKIIQALDIPGHVLIKESEIEKIKEWRMKHQRKGRPKQEEKIGGTL